MGAATRRARGIIEQDFTHVDVARRFAAVLRAAPETARGTPCRDLAARALVDAASTVSRADGTMLRGVVTGIDQALCDAIASVDDRWEWGASLVAVAIEDDGVALTSIGTCRAHRRRRDRFDLLTRDDTLASEHPYAPPDVGAIIVRDLGGGLLDRIDVSWLAREPGDLFVLTTRGATNRLATEALGRLTAEPWETADALASRIVDAAVAAPAPEHEPLLDASAVVVRIG
jgi:serine/threonine protein phosphatase PrpC